MDYFYTQPEKIATTSLIIDGDEFTHLTHVMRKRVGDTIRIVDGLGTAHDAEIKEITKKTATAAILETYKNHNEHPVAITLAVGILKNPSRFDFLVEKVTELGAKEIIPLRTDRTIPSHAKVDRWQKLALAAMKQSGRSFLPMVRNTKSLDEFLNDTNSFDLKLIAHEKEEENAPIRIAPSSRSASSMVILIGPEGGFSDEEVNRCVDAGYQRLYLGERRLRTETAAIVAVSKFIVP